MLGRLRILVTGSEGLVGTALGAALRARGHEVVPLDVRGADPVDVRDADAVEARARGCHGVVHLAAVSRVVWAERDPAVCESTNVGGTVNVLERSGDAWVLFASSREVYGQPTVSPTPESAPLAPLNVYGRAKVAGEQRVLGAREAGRRTAVVRLSNVYGAAPDHADRVVPAFARAAATGGELRVDGLAHAFDFVWLDDAVDGLLRIIGQLAEGAVLPPLHLVTGQSTTLGALAELAVRCAGTGATVRTAAPRAFDVERFCGDPRLAAEVLGWRATTGIEAGMERMVRAFR
ncbi:MAG: NAD-dependent epimerase/dehydratase family protein [Alphaproteobacteria bacterium]|nr:NAD-dependent epimerase/dehydratase family protein [Alphaproteobacteria bacterium]